MIIEKVEASEKLEQIIEEGFEKYETKYRVACNYTPFYFVAKENDEIVGVITGFTCFLEIYIDDLIVMENYRGKNIGTQLIKIVEKYYKNYGLNNINLCTYEFQAPKFYEKLGFQLEFIRKNKDNPKLNKYYYVKFFDENK